MAEQINNKKDNRGFLNKNGYKNKATQPDWTGNIMVDGKEKRVSGWINKTADGREYISLTIQEPLTPEQQNQYRQNASDGPAENPIPNSNSSNASATTHTDTTSSNRTNNSEYTPSQSEFDLSDDISKILKGGEDDDPFN